MENYYCKGLLVELTINEFTSNRKFIFVELV